MDKTFLRNFLLFILILFVCAGSLIFGLLKSERELARSDEWVLHTNNIITKSKEVATLVEKMLAAQRGYLLTLDEEFQENYEMRKKSVSNLIAELSDLISGNPSQLMRLNELQNHFLDFSKQLEERANNVSEQTVNASILDDVERINNIRSDIERVNTAFLIEEYSLLKERIAAVENKKSEYFYILLIGITAGTVLLLIFNAFLLRAQSKRTLIEKSLQDTENRFALAIEGSQDGIFDWDIEKGTVFYSRRYFELIGDNKDATISDTEEFKGRLHPEDAPKVWKHVEHYLSGELSEYAQEFRMKHKSGRWVWIQARAKALFDSKGKPSRMIGAHTDITHMIAAQERLENEKKEAEKANELKSEFLAHMSHEIRTPLTAISGIAEIMQKNQTNLDTKQKQLINTLNSSTSSLKDLINDILDFSRIESGELELDNENFDLPRLFESAISMMSLRASEKGVNFVFDYSEVEGQEFYGDEKRLRQILINLIGNALKFTEKGGVSVKAYYELREEDEFLRVDVSDTGIGIAPENFDLVFERFKQADSSVSRKYGGTGLGLPISKNLSQLMGGDIFLSSELNKGSTFSLIIPQKIKNKKSKEDKSSNVAKINDKIRQSLRDETKVLLVEDYEGNIVVIGYILDDLNISYDVAKTGLEALELWEENHYSLILMDIQMPEMDGFAATAEIRKLEKSRDLNRTPIIGMTAHALVGDRDKCIEAGMDSYLPKPIVESDLKTKIYKYLNQKKAA